MIVRLDADGAVVRDADDCGRLHLETDLDERGLRAALAATGTGELVDAGTARLDVGVLRSRAALLATAPGWADRFSTMIDHAREHGRLSADGRSVRAPVERPSGQV